VALIIASLVIAIALWIFLPLAFLSLMRKIGQPITPGDRPHWASREQNPTRQSHETKIGNLMVRLITGDLFACESPAIGHGVNTRGLMGAGIAKQIRARYPGVYAEYKTACRTGSLTVGQAHLFHPQEPGKPVLVNLATQDDIGARARLEWIWFSLIDAGRKLSDLGIAELAIPRIGCGIGGLDFGHVLYEIESASQSVNFDIHVYTPATSPTLVW